MRSLWNALFEQLSARNHHRSDDGKTKYLVRQEDGNFLCTSIWWSLGTDSGSTVVKVLRYSGGPR
jgi:hypothetical protein